MKYSAGIQTRGCMIAQIDRSTGLGRFPIFANFPIIALKCFALFDTPHCEYHIID